jgi:hypothetical protein
MQGREKDLLFFADKGRPHKGVGEKKGDHSKC